MIIYKTINLINDKIYIGQSKNNDNTYFGSGVAINIAIKKYGKSNFKKEIIIEFDFEDKDLLNDSEKYWIKNFNSNNRLIGYNMTEGGDGGFGFLCSEETKRKIGIKHKGKIITEEHRKCVSIANKNRKWSINSRKKLSDNYVGMTGKRHSEETKNIMKGPKSEDHKRKISESRKRLYSIKRFNKEMNIFAIGGY